MEKPTTIKGRLLRVMPPSEQTDPQKKAGICRQSVEMEGHGWGAILHMSHHLSPSEEGETFEFSGVEWNEWTDREENKRINWQTNKSTLITRVKRESTVVTVPTGDTLNLQGMANHHRACFDAIRIAYPDQPDTLLAPFATTLFIETKGKWNASPATPAKPATTATTAKPEHSEELRDRLTGKTVDEMSDSELIDLRIRVSELIQDGNESERLKAFQLASKNAMTARNLPVEGMVDALIDQAEVRNGKEAVSKVFAKLSEAGKNGDAANLWVLCHIKKFREMAAQAEKP